MRRDSTGAWYLRIEENQKIAEEMEFNRTGGDRY